MATEAGLPNNARKDSTGICFIGERPFREFLARYLTGEPGPIETLDGRKLGEHAGLIHYTLGQRHGLRVGGRRDSAESAWYVAAKQADRNALVVVQGRGHPALWSAVVEGSALHWLGDEPAEFRMAGQLQCTARIRHRQADTACTVLRRDAGSCRVSFEAPQWAVAPGQYVVFYQGETCLGGAVIDGCA
jgi:tRNA-specific 2-thiouridylase